MVINRFLPPRYRTIDEISRGDCDIWFGISPFDLRRLFIACRVPEQFVRASSRHVFGGEECFIIMMYHLIKGVPFTAMARLFGGDPRYFSWMFDMMVDHLYNTFYHKISGTSLSQWFPRYVHTCRRLIYDALSDSALFETEYVNGEVVDSHWIVHHWDWETFRPCAWLDDMAMQTARVGSWTRQIRNYRHDVQRAFYSGYLRAHGLKAQVVYLPIGIIGAVFITELRQNDNGVQNMSGLNNYLVQLFAGIFIGGLFPALYGDGIFAVLATILPRFRNPTPELHLLNVRLASLRECIEHLFADHHVRFQLFDVPHRLRLFGAPHTPEVTRSGVKIRRMCLVSFFILNCYYCIRGTRCEYFGQIPPTLEEYIPLGEVLLPPPAVDLGDVWEYN